ncbi:unnamed protein product [Microthlaspi erraticum]|uniref:Acidic protein n=1 Tax=Microthlaspi erraticum TaxID=1685480 RepID=A0A6D2KUS0_9BRAS|nr:unnamed protein product [Microthlaspi erraticum]
MASKTVIVGVLIMSMVMAQTQVEANDCCPNAQARANFDVLKLAGVPSVTAAAASGCKLVSGYCPPGFLYGDLQNSGDVANAYCKLGCVSSACGAITTLQSSDKSEIVIGSLEQCAKACLTLCTKGSITTRGSGIA